MNVGRYLRGEDQHVGTARISKKVEPTMADKIKQAFEAWAAPILGDNPNWRESGPCELARQAWRASRAAMVPMTNEQAVALVRKSYEAQAHGDQWLIRATEAHHGVVARPREKG